LCCDNFLYGFKGTPSGRTSSPAFGRDSGRGDGVACLLLSGLRIL
jgi:hypothetical protein